MGSPGQSLHAIVSTNQGSNAVARVSGGNLEIVLDLSRLLSRILYATPTGVDRVEMEYAIGLIDAVPDRLSFAAVQPSGMYGRLDRDAVREFLAALQRRWTDPTPPAGRWPLWRQVGLLLLRLRPRAVPALRSGRKRVYLQASPHHLDRRTLVETILRKERAALVCLVHDLIPIEYPEYAMPKGADRHRARIATLVALCDGIITNSDATRVSLGRHLQHAGRRPPVRVAHLGNHALAVKSAEMPRAPAGEAPYFVCIGTIEPRKNHLLLLNVWRRMAEERGVAETPRLVLVGRRGWENEQVIDMLERCPALHDRVEERTDMSDRAVAALLAGARAVLLPSFAEGFGMPVTEALAAGVPVICSDLPALREVGGNVPDFLDPLDGLAWLALLNNYIAPDSQRRQAQLARLRGWTAPTWRAHLDTVLELVENVAQ